MVKVMSGGSVKGVVRSRLILLAAFLLVLMVVSAKGAKASTQFHIPAVADAYVDSAKPDFNFGSSLFLFTHNYSESVAQSSAGSSTQNEVGPIVRSWTKFDLSKIPSQAIVDSATLRIHTAMWGTRSVNEVSVFICEDNSWTESAISWNNAPSELNSNPLDTLECANPDVDYSFDVSSVINGKRTISLVLETIELSKEPAVFNSKDLNPSTGPTLIVDYDLPVDLWVFGAAGLGVIVLVAVVAVLFFRSRKGMPKRLRFLFLDSRPNNPKPLF